MVWKWKYRMAACGIFRDKKTHTQKRFEVFFNNGLERFFDGNRLAPEFIDVFSIKEYIAIGIDVDHVHIHMMIPPKYSVSEVVDIIKTNTSGALKAKFGFLSKTCWDKRGIWGKGFFVSTVGINERIIRKYVEMQGEEDTGQAKLEF
ncbi:MAG: hypothetical protein B6I30_00360 [Desulfobacteraceae bacterium 4572_187]|nr:MAG: hypothetical protein B6I30_00360 [Desulfobacteraceae bacterium 4572_187]